MMTLRQIGRSRLFESVRDFEDAARFHVWHDRLGIKTPIDNVVVEALARGKGCAVVGRPGSGKTSTLAAAALGTDGMAARHLPLHLSAVSGDVFDHAHDPRYFAARLVRDIATLSQEIADLRDDAATTGTAIGAAATWRASLGTRSAGLAKEIRQRTENIDFERTPNEVIGVAITAVETLRAEGLRPVILLEDADGLLRVPGRTHADRDELASAFFADGLRPLLARLDTPALIAAQPEYRRLEGFESLGTLLDGVYDAPRPQDLSAGGVELLLAELLTTADVDRTVRELFSDEALALLVANRYSIRQTFRTMIEICDRSLKHAIGEKTVAIEEPSVVYALTQSNA